MRRRAGPSAWDQLGELVNIVVAALFLLAFLPLAIIAQCFSGRRR